MTLCEDNTSKVAEIKQQRITKDDIASQHIAKISVCADVTSSFVVSPASRSN